MEKCEQNHRRPHTSPAELLGLGCEAYYLKDYGNRSPEKYLWLLSDIIKHGKPGNILDLGCGLGLFLEIASKWGLDITGCDGSEDAVRMALRRDPKLRINRCLLGSRLPFEAGTFDNVVLNQVIEHLPPEVLSNVLIECNRILRPGGMLFIYSPNKANRREVKKDPTHINPLYPSELRAILLSVGFEVVLEPNDSRFIIRFPGGWRFSAALMRTALNDWLSASTNAYAKKK